MGSTGENPLQGDFPALPRLRPGEASPLITAKTQSVRAAWGTLMREYRDRAKAGQAGVRQLIVGCCLALMSCNVKEAGNERSAGIDNEFIGENQAITDNGAFAVQEFNSPLSPQENALSAREGSDNERLVRWQDRVRPRPANAFPKIGTCYESRIKKIALHHQRVSGGKLPDGEALQKGSDYWDDDWGREENPVRENGRIAIPFNGHMVYDNGLEQFFGGHWSKSEAPPFAHSRVGDRVEMCVVELPDHCPSGDFRGVIYRTHDLRTGGVWEEADSLHMCGGQ